VNKAIKKIRNLDIVQQIKMIFCVCYIVTILLKRYAVTESDILIADISACMALEVLVHPATPTVYTVEYY
jgi:hypothetical protein